MNLHSLEDVVAAVSADAGMVALVSSLSCECMLLMKAMDLCCGSSIASLSLPSAKQYASCSVQSKRQHFINDNNWKTSLQIG